MSGRETMNGWLYYATLPIVFISMSIYVFHRYCSNRVSRARPVVIPSTTSPSQVNYSPPAPLDPTVISALPMFTYKKPASPPPSSTATVVDCPICLGKVEEGEVVRVLPNCLHIFHLDCIDMWFHSHSTCPICRTGAEPMVLVDLVVEGREPDHG